MAENTIPEITVLEKNEDLSDIFLTDLSTNTVLFCYHKKRLNVLLGKFPGTEYFILPGGYIRKEEDVDNAALRSLEEGTGLENIYLEQFYVAGKSNRTESQPAKDLIQSFNQDTDISNWVIQRKVSICYYALVSETKLKPKTKKPFFSEITWAKVQQLPKLLFDHKFIIQKAISRLQLDMDRKLISNHLLDETFTMPELRAVYEAVYQRKFTRSNFQRKMLNMNILERLGKKHDGESHKAPYLYKFKKSKIEKPFES